MDSNVVVTDTPVLSPSVVDSYDYNSDVTGFNWSKLLKYSIIILILLFLGFNLFNYLGKGLDIIKDLFSPILAWFGYGVGETSKAIISTTAGGTKSAIDITSKTLTSGINVLENELTGKALKDKAIRNKIPQPDDSSSTTQLSKPKSKAGYCYIGEDRGFRSCIEVGEGDQCMSGDIFPTMDVCVNPRLRA